MPSMKTTIAAGVTVLALGGLTAVALSAGATDNVAATTPAAQTSPPTEVRTVVVKHVIHRTIRAKAASTAVGEPAPAPPAAVAPTPAPATVRVATSAPTPAPTPSVADDPRGEREGAGDDDGPSRGDFKATGGDRGDGGGDD